MKSLLCRPRAGAVDRPVGAGDRRQHLLRADLRLRPVRLLLGLVHLPLRGGRQRLPRLLRLPGRRHGHQHG